MKRFYLMLLALFAFSSSVLVGTASAASKDPIIINGHKFVDLGLPSGLLWAERLMWEPRQLLMMGTTSRGVRQSPKHRIFLMIILP